MSDNPAGLRDLIQRVLDRTPEERTGDLAGELVAALQPQFEDRVDAAIAKYVLDQGGARKDRDQLKKLLEEALHLRMHGERAPGGQENWRDWDIKTERTLRALLDQQTALWET